MKRPACTNGKRSISVYDRITVKLLGSLVLLIVLSAIAALSALLRLSHLSWVTILVAIVLIFVTIIALRQFDPVSVISETRARAADIDEFQAYANCVEAIAIAAGIPAPSPYVIDDPTINAFSVGYSPKRASICVTTGLLNAMDRSELEGIVAHEISHIRAHDIVLVRLVNLASVLIYMLTTRADYNSEGMEFLGKRWFHNFMAVVLVLLVAGTTYVNPAYGFNLICGVLIIAGVLLLRFACIYVLPAAFLRERDLLADAEAALLTRFPDGLIHALEKIGNRAQKLKHGEDMVAEILFVPTVPQTAAKKVNSGLFARCFPTRFLLPHPTPKERIERLQEIRAASKTEEAASDNRVIS